MYGESFNNVNNKNFQNRKSKVRFLYSLNVCCYSNNHISIKLIHESGHSMYESLQYNE